jgi:hypothetical protein
MWWVFNGTIWQQMTQWVSASTFNWTPTTPGNYYVGYWVKNQGSTPANGSFDTAIVRPYTVTAAAPCSNPVLNSTPPGPTVQRNQLVALTAGVNCGGTANYLWWVGTVNGANVNWVQMSPNWVTTNTLNWTPTVAGTYHVGFWAKNQGSAPTNGSFDTALSRIYTVP